MGVDSNGNVAAITLTFYTPDDMIGFLKKYGLNIALLAILTALILYLIPHEEKHYLQPEIDSVKKIAHSVAIWVAIIVFVLLFLLRLKQINKMRDFFSSLALVAIVSVAAFFLMETVLFPATLLINRLSTSTTVDKNYTVMYIDTTHKTVLLWDAETEEKLQADRFFPTLKKKRIENRQMITVQYGEGLLGFNVNPVMK